MSDINDILASTTFDQLKSEEQTQILNVIDELRSHNVGQLLGEDDIPQLVVCGDESSGKSSLLASLTRVRFPVRSNNCANFATELRLRREATLRITSRINPSDARTPEEKGRLSSFSGSFDSPDKFPELVTAARACMEEKTGDDQPTFFDDVLQVEIAAPDLLPLTIVDLPGLIHSRDSSETNHDINIVTSLVKRYMKQHNSIILAVIPANTSINTQVVLKHLKQIVPDGSRTLGVITKPDELAPGTKRERDFINLARHNKSNFEYGWHVVRNRNYDEQPLTNEERDEVERTFFAKSAWSNLPAREVGCGIESLRTKLGKMLVDHIRDELYSIGRRLITDFGSTQAELGKLGPSRDSEREQYDYLYGIGDKFSEYTKEALEGRYRRPTFFGDPLEEGNLHKRLRAKIRDLNDEFVTTMFTKGHKWQIVDDSATPSSSDDESEHEEFAHPNIIAKSVFLQKHVALLAHYERGNELPGMSNPFLVGSLFREQSEPWDDLAFAHVERAYDAVKDFLETLLLHLTDERTCDRILTRIIYPAMENRFEALKRKLEELLRPRRDYEPFTLDPRFSCRLSTYRETQMRRDLVDAVLREAKLKGIDEALAMKDEIISQVYAEAAPVDGQFGTNEIYAFMEAYYEPALWNFLNNLATLGIEQCLLSDLPKLLSDSVIRGLDETQVAYLAAESPDIVSERSRFQRRAEILMKGFTTINSISVSSIRKHRNAGIITLPSRQGINVSEYCIRPSPDWNRKLSGKASTSAPALHKTTDHVPPKLTDPPSATPADQTKAVAENSCEVNRDEKTNNKGQGGEIHRASSASLQPSSPGGSTLSNCLGTSSSGSGSPFPAQPTRSLVSFATSVKSSPTSQVPAGFSSYSQTISPFASLQRQDGLFVQNAPTPPRFGVSDFGQGRQSNLGSSLTQNSSGTRSTSGLFGVASPSSTPQTTTTSGGVHSIFGSKPSGSSSSPTPNSWGTGQTRGSLFGAPSSTSGSSRTSFWMTSPPHGPFTWTVWNEHRPSIAQSLPPLSPEISFEEYRMADYAKNLRYGNPTASSS